MLESVSLGNYFPTFLFWLKKRSTISVSEGKFRESEGKFREFHNTSVGKFLKKKNCLRLKIRIKFSKNKANALIPIKIRLPEAEIVIFMLKLFLSKNRIFWATASGLRHNLRTLMYFTYFFAEKF